MTGSADAEADVAAMRVNTSPEPCLLQALALLLMVIAMAVMRNRFEHFSGAALLLVIAAAIVVGISLLAPGRYTMQTSGALKCLLVALFVAALIISFTQLPPLAGPFAISKLAWIVLLIGIVVDRKARVAPYLFAVLLVWHSIIGLWFLARSAEPRIDVYLIQSLGAENLLHGINPYAITFPDIYGPNAHFYPPGIVVNGQVQCGYFYWPMSLLLAVPGYVLGDVRYTHLVSLTLAAAVVGYGRSTRVSFLSAAVILFCPGIFLLLINAWIEPQMLLLLAAAVWFALRPGRASKVGTFILLGALLAEKQYILLTLPLIRLLVPESGAKRLIRAGAVVALCAVLIIFPFFLWNPQAFLHSSRALYVNLIRTDAISIPAWLKLRFDIQLRLWLTGTIGAAAAILIAWRARRTPATFAAAMAFVLTVSFLFSTQAFLNYYFLAMGCLCVAIAAGESKSTCAQSS